MHKCCSSSSITTPELNKECSLLIGKLLYMSASLSITGMIVLMCKLCCNKSIHVTMTHHCGSIVVRSATFQHERHFTLASTRQS